VGRDRPGHLAYVIEVKGHCAHAHCQRLPTSAHQQWYDALGEHLELSALVGQRPQEDALRARACIRQQR
jgi:hypothetical protein